MAPSNSHQYGGQNNDDLGPSRQDSRHLGGMARSAVATRRLRNEESWVEISSQPSSSSLSSIGDEIVTTGLRVSGHPSADPPLRRRRVSHPGGHAQSRSGLAGGARQMSTSSQEEYEESSTESEDDQVMTSSNEHVASYTRVPPASMNDESNNSGEESDDDDENATALGLRVSDKIPTRHEQSFTPQPNAFSHPPSSQQRNSMPGSYFPRSTNDTPSFQQRQSYPGRPSRTQHGENQSHSPYNAISPSHHYRPDDHDAALRASLTTLLSCAAAARGLPKRNQSGFGVAGGVAAGTSTSTSTRPEFTGLRLVPESELTAPVPQPPTRRRSSPSISEQERDSRDATAAAAATAAPANDKGKRKATPASAKPSAAQKKKRLVSNAVQEEAVISPTLLTWVVSAGVVVLVSVVGFGAGYAMGREVGRQEAMNSLVGGAAGGGMEGTCGKEVGRSVGELRKLRFGAPRGIVA